LPADSPTRVVIGRSSAAEGAPSEFAAYQPTRVVVLGNALQRSARLRAWMYHYGGW
jgi:hypothetical protein